MALNRVKQASFGSTFLALRCIPSHGDILLPIELMCLFHNRFGSSVTLRYLNLYTRSNMVSFTIMENACTVMYHL